MQGFGLSPTLLPQKSSSLAVWTVAAPWMETSPSVRLSTPSLVPYSLRAATRVVLAMSQA